jgi:hypothetical protein
MSDIKTDEAHDAEVIEDVLGVSPETAAIAAEDQDSPGARKPSSDAVEQERIARARSGDTGAR